MTGFSTLSHFIRPVAIRLIATADLFCYQSQLVTGRLLSSDPLSGANVAYIEIAFSNATNNAGTDFTNLFQSTVLDPGFATDTYFSVSTSIATIPVI